MELYYLFPLDRPRTHAGRPVRTTVLATGVALVLLLGAGRRAWSPGWWSPRSGSPPGPRSGSPPACSTSGWRSTARTTWPLLAASFNQMAANLQRQILRLEEMSRLQRRFTSDVSHELRTPLTTVRMAADLIFAERDEFDPAVARSAELLQAELDRFEEPAHRPAGDQPVRRRLRRARRRADRPGAGGATGSSTGWPALAERVGVTDRAATCRTDPVIAEVDPRRVERMLRNLVGNAVEHGEGQPVDGHAWPPTSGAVAITVRDHGVGLKPGEEKLVFNRFWRADPSRARQTGGTGLGLSISVEDARLHGGWLEAWGAPGGGAQFRLTLPVRAGDRLVASPLPLVPPATAPSTRVPRRAIEPAAPARGRRPTAGEPAEVAR